MKNVLDSHDKFQQQTRTVIAIAMVVLFATAFIGAVIISEILMLM